jgi:hypothetical protein
MVMNTSPENLYRENLKEENKMRQTNTITLNVFGQPSRQELQTTNVVTSTNDNIHDEYDRIPSEEDIIHQHEAPRKTDVSFGLDALTFQHLMKY